MHKTPDGRKINMRIILLVLIALLTEKCHEDSSRNINIAKDDTIQKQVIFNHKTKDSLKLKELLGFNDENSSALIIQNDTVFFLIFPRFNNSKYEYVRNFYYDSVNKVFHFNYNARENNNAGSINLQPFLNGSQVYLKSFLKTGIIYSKLTGKLKGDPQIKRILSDPTKIQMYNNYYYIINTESPKAINVYNTITNELKTFFFNDLIIDVTDFFLFDLDKDGGPEVFILHKGLIPREEIISYSIYSLRTDSIKIISK